MNPDFLDLLRAFAAADVRFLIVGAYALALHGRPRATGDLDIWIDPTPQNARRVMRGLAEFRRTAQRGCRSGLRCARGDLSSLPGSCGRCSRCQTHSGLHSDNGHRDETSHGTVDDFL
jgi:hypothetical protein